MSNLPQIAELLRLADEYDKQAATAEDIALASNDGGEALAALRKRNQAKTLRDEAEALVSDAQKEALFDSVVEDIRDLWEAKWTAEDHIDRFGAAALLEEKWAEYKEDDSLFLDDEDRENYRNTFGF